MDDASKTREGSEDRKIYATSLRENRCYVFVDGPRLRELREKKYLARKDLASKAGVSEDVITGLETNPDRSTLPNNFKRIADALECKTDEERNALKRQGPKQVDATLSAQAPQPAAPRRPLDYSLLPPAPQLFIGRDDDLQNLKKLLVAAPERGAESRVSILTAVHGLPGIGKTTTATMVAHDSDLQSAFPDGVLWTSLGHNPDLLSKLIQWGISIGLHHEILKSTSLSHARNLLTGALRDKRVLLIVDDVWQAEHAEAFRVGGPDCSLLLTSRLPTVANAIAALAQRIVHLNPLGQEDSMRILRALCPQVVEDYPLQCEDLARGLEGLPLSLQVAGRLLRVELGFGLRDITSLLAELETGKRLLEATPPADLTELERETESLRIPTVAALLRKSTDLLDEHARECFAWLGAQAASPAVFDRELLRDEIWRIPDPDPMARILADRGLIEPIGNGRFRMHALLVLHARSLCSI